MSIVFYYDYRTELTSAVPLLPLPLVTPSLPLPHNPPQLVSLPPRPLLHIALSAGLSALKTPACHSAFTSSSANASSSTTTVCPICSTELNELARNVPYAHHTKSIVENDPVVLPNGRIYGSERLRLFNEKVGTEKGWVRDPVAGKTDELWKDSEVRRVFVL